MSIGASSPPDKGTQFAIPNCNCFAIFGLRSISATHSWTAPSRLATGGSGTIVADCDAGRCRSWQRAINAKKFRGVGFQRERIMFKFRLLQLPLLLLALISQGSAQCPRTDHKQIVDAARRIDDGCTVPITFGARLERTHRPRCRVTLKLFPSSAWAAVAPMHTRIRGCTRRISASSHG